MPAYTTNPKTLVPVKKKKKKKKKKVENAS